MIHLSASLLAADHAALGEEVRRADKAGVDSFHFDMMDGRYVPNFALTPAHLEALRRHSHLPFHVHLELENPDEVLSKFRPFPADLIIVQWDTVKDLDETLARIRSRDCRAGLAFNPGDDCSGAASCLGRLDLLLLLGVHPGFGGQTMLPGIWEQVVRARHLADRSERPITVAVDGGVKPGNAAELVKAGADCLIMGTALFHSSDMQGTVRSIRESTSASPGR